MDVGIVEAGEDEAAARLDETRARPAPGIDFLVAADRHDALAEDGDRFGERPLGVARPDAGARDDEVGRGPLRGTAGAAGGRDERGEQESAQVYDGAMSILKFLGYDPGRTATAGETAETETVRKIVAALDRLEPDRARYVAAFAYILSRVARADLAISEPEVRAMETIVTHEGRLSPEQAILVVQMAKTQTILFGGTENYLVTREFNRLAAREEKMALLRCLFAISASDDSVSVKEDNEIRRISKELHLTHRDFIDTRSGFRDHLPSLRKPPETAC